MFRELRGKKNAITDEAAKELLKESRRGVLAVIGDDAYPYAIPVNYLFDEANLKIYFHGARSGHKYDSIKANDIFQIQLHSVSKVPIPHPLLFHYRKL